MWRNTSLCLADRWYLAASPNSPTICRLNTPHGERGKIVGLSIYCSDWASNRQQEGMYLPLQLRVRSRSELQKSLSLGNESNTWYTQQRTPPKEKQDGMKRKLPALYSGTNDISISWLMCAAFEYTQTEVKRFFSWLSILFYMTNKVIRYIKFCCCSYQGPFPCCANFGL